MHAAHTRLQLHAMLEMCLTREARYWALAVAVHGPSLGWRAVPAVVRWLVHAADTRRGHPQTRPPMSAAQDVTGTYFGLQAAQRWVGCLLMLQILCGFPYDLPTYALRHPLCSNFHHNPMGPIISWKFP